MRAAGPADNLNHYTSGYIAQGKAMAGQKGDLHWKAFVVFDVVSAVEQLEQDPEGTLRLAIDWVKSGDDVRDIHVVYVGSLPKAKFVDQDMWEIFPRNKGIWIGGKKAEELAKHTGRDWLEIELKGKIPSGEVSPANRYMVFRIESEPLENPEGNGLVGLSADSSRHTLIIAGENDADSMSTGGY
jgi:hypothetical protein